MPTQKRDVLPKIVTCGIAALVFGRFLLIVLADREHWIAFIPDDAYYYLGFGRGFVSTGQWTFDGGVSHSSGFHVLQAYLAAACWAAFHHLSVDAPVHALMALSAVFNVVSALVCTRLVTRLFGPYASLAVLLVFSSKNALICGMSGMEWSLAILSLTLAAEIALSSHSSTAASLGSSFVFGAFAVFSRSDNLIWVSIAIAASLLTRHLRNCHRVLMALGFGMIFGALLIALHTHSITGDWIQDSVLAKLAWGAQRGLDFAGALRTFGMATGVSFLGKGSDGFALVALVIWGAARAYYEVAERRAALLFGSLTIVAALASGARNSGGLQYWYTDAAVLPFCMLWGSLMEFSSARTIGARSLSVFGVLASVIGNVATARSGPWQNQPAFLHAGLRLRADDWSACRVGAWNAGILAYYRGRDIVNLDGLANHDALVASQRGELAEYLARARVSYVVDFAAMVERAEFRSRGGYREGLSLREVERAPSNEPRWLESSLTYWRVAARRAGAEGETECHRPR